MGTDETLRKRDKVLRVTLQWASILPTESGVQRWPYLQARRDSDAFSPSPSPTYNVEKTTKYGIFGVTTADFF